MTDNGAQQAIDKMAAQMLQEARVKISDATLDVARKTIAELPKYEADGEKMLAKATALNLPVEQYLTHRETLEAEKAQLDAELAKMEKKEAELDESISGATRNSLFAGGLSAIAAMGGAFFKFIKGKDDISITKKGLWLAAGAAVGAVIGVVTSMFTVNPKKAEQIELSEQMAGPKLKQAGIDAQKAQLEGEFKKIFVIELLKSDLQAFTAQKQAETAQIKDDTEAAKTEAEEKPKNPVKIVLDKAEQVVNKPHKEKVEAAKEAAAENTETVVSM